MDAHPGISAAEALERLSAGNARYASGGLRAREQLSLRRTELVGAQHPFAVVLSCADSRVPPELVFDQGLGDLYCVRIAGAVADGAGLGTIEYAVEYLHVPLLYVLGHEKCAAIGATLSALEGVALDGFIGVQVGIIAPALTAVAADPGPGLVDAVEAAVRYEIARVTQVSTILAGAHASGKLTIRGGYYSLADGRVTQVL